MMDWLTRLMVDTPQPKKEAAPVAATPATQATLAEPVAAEPALPPDKPVEKEAVLPKPIPVPATIDDDVNAIYWRQRAETAEAELAAIPDALRKPPAGYEWVGEIQVDTINNGVWIPFRKVTREVTITLPSDATDAEILAAFRAAAE